MTIVFHGNSATGNTPSDICGAVPTSHSEAYNFTDSGSPVNNDKARSCLLMDVHKGTQITVADNPDGRTDDDYTVITVLQDTQDPVAITSFEESWQTNQMLVQYHKVNGLDGKVSHVGVQSS